MPLSPAGMWPLSLSDPVPATMSAYVSAARERRRGAGRRRTLLRKRTRAQQLHHVLVVDNLLLQQQLRDLLDVGALLGRKRLRRVSAADAATRRP